jgi:hypothetical protein
MRTVPTISKEELNDTALVCKILRESGVLMVPGYVGAGELSGLTKEFHFALEQKENVFIRPFPYSQGKGCVVVNEKIDKQVLPFTAAAFNSPLMRKISKEYLNGEVRLNYDIYCVKDVIGSKHHANDLHFDVLPCFKFFIYLSDTTEQNGAFACVPGSIVQAAEIRKKYGDKVSFENRELTRDLPFTEKDAVSVEGKAGSLIIFDTDVFHRAGNVSAGERWVMRGHTRLKTQEKEPAVKQAGGVLSKFRQIFRSK